MLECKLILDTVPLHIGFIMDLRYKMEVLDGVIRG